MPNQNGVRHAEGLPETQLFWFSFDSEPVNNLSDSCNYRKLPSSYAAFTPKSFDLFLPGLL